MILLIVDIYCVGLDWFFVVGEFFDIGYLFYGYWVVYWIKGDDFFDFVVDV